MTNPYGNGNSAKKILKIICDINSKNKFKKFYDL